MNNNKITKITIPVRFPDDDPFAEEASGRAGAPLPKEITITVSEETALRLNSQDSFSANRAFDDLHEIIQAELDSLGFGGIEFDFG